MTSEFGRAIEAYFHVVTESQIRRLRIGATTLGKDSPRVRAIRGWCRCEAVGTGGIMKGTLTD